MSVPVDETRTATLRQLVEVIDHAAIAIFKAKGQLLPKWHMVDREGNHIVKPANMTNKDVDLAVMKVFFAFADIVAVVLMSEAWAVDARERVISDAEREKMDREGLEHHPGRIEIIMYRAEDEEGALLAQRLIMRSPSGKPKLGPLEFPEGANSPRAFAEGRFAGGFLPRRGPLQ